ncbi:MAG: hypothetical protein ABFD89_05325 [Bryobacteraceae bacterium]
MHFIVQSTFCCGRTYYRRRSLSGYIKDPDRKLWRGHRTHCDHCGRPLEWGIRYKGHTAHSRWYFRIKGRNAALGLTAAGTPRIKRPAFDHTKYCRQWRAANIALGLTSKGRPRKISRLGLPSNPIEIAWRQFRASMSIPDSASAIGD